MILKGKILSISDRQERGEFFWRDVVIEGQTADDNEPQKYGLQSIKDASDNFVKYNNVGDVVEATFFVNPREWEGKYFTNLNLTYCKTIEGGAAATSSGTPQPLTPSDDLPF